MKMPPWPVPLGHKPIDLGLERVRELLKRLGNPHHRLPPVIHIAGTNGKGSTLAFIRAMLEAAELRVHVYTSPHLVEFNERIVLAGQTITDDELLSVLEQCKQATGDIPVTFFEGTTVAALLAFSQVEADIVLLETGMGGRLDATNVIDRPAATIITPIDFDHMSYLGNTIEKIAAEKAAIIKPGVPCIVSPQHPEAMAVIENEAQAKNAPLYRCGQEWQVEEGVYRSAALTLPLPELGLKGAHQPMNAGAALACIESLRGVSLTPVQMEQGLKNVVWPARLQRLTRGTLVELLPEGGELWLDGGHNESAARVIATQAQVWQQQDAKPLCYIIGMIEGKDVAAFLSPLKKNMSACYVVDIPGEAMATKAEVLNQIAKSVEIRAEVAVDAASAVKHIVSQSSNPARIIIAGSLYLAGTILEENV